MKRFLTVMLIVLLCSMALSCSKPKVKEVVVYTSVDNVFSEPVLKDFEKTTGVKVKAVYDVEASKTTGLVNRLLAEKDRPQCDVFCVIFPLLVTASDWQ